VRDERADVEALLRARLAEFEAELERLRREAPRSAIRTATAACQARADRLAQRAAEVAREVEATGSPVQIGRIIAELDRREITAPRGGAWSRIQVQRALARTSR